MIGQLQKSARFSPVVAVLGLRQSGKSTLLSGQRTRPVDLAWADIPIKVSVSPRSQAAYDGRALSAAMKELKAKAAILGWTHAGVELESRGISRMPWTHCS